MRERVKRNFILQQGFEEPSPVVCPRQYSALHFQGRLVFVFIVAGVVFQSAPLLRPLRRFVVERPASPAQPFRRCLQFDISPPSQCPSPCSRAPAPRRTAQSMAGPFALACGLLIHFHLFIDAYIVEGVFLAPSWHSFSREFCVGSFVYYLVLGRGGFGRQTLPWAS
jgi:hypothetical protein